MVERSDEESTDTKRGLASADAKQRLAAEGPNELPEQPRPSLIVDLARRVLEPLNLALVVAGCLTTFLLDERIQGMTIVALALLNATIGGFLERRADAASAELGKMMSLTARVIRDGATVDVPSRELVRGDIVVLAPGAQVPADLELIEATNLRVDEALLTGESLPVEKHGGIDQLFSATQISGGVGIGRVTKTGAATRVGAIAGLLNTASRKTPLQRQLSRLTGRLGIVSVAIGAIAALTTYLRTGGVDHRVSEAILVGVALALAAVPEGLPTAVTSALAFSGLRLARRGAIVKSLTALEGLGITTVLCTDKTGTLTEGTLEVIDVVTTDEADLWTAVLRCNDATRTSDDVDLALVRAAPSDASREIGDLARMVPFDAALRTMTTVHRLGDGRLIFTVKGAPEVVLSKYCWDSGDELLVTAKDLMDRGRRVLAVATYLAEKPLDDDAITRVLSMENRAEPFVPVGLVGFGDPVRPSAHAAVLAAKRFGARVVMVTGDNAGTARAVASVVGMDTHPIVTGPELANMSQDERNASLASAAIVARVEPETKFALIDALHAQGEIVAMTGDGVNDAPALQRADIGIAVGGPRATDVARQSAAVVLSDGDLSTVVRAIEHGRRIHRNLRSTVAYLLTGNLSEIFLILGCLVVYPSITTPLLPAQLLWINFVTDTIPALVLGIDTKAVDGAARRDRALFTRAAWINVIARGSLLAAIALVSAAGSGTDARQRQSQLMASLVCCHLVLAYVVRSRRFAWEKGWATNRLLLGVIGASVVLQVLMFSFGPTRDALGIVDIGVMGWVRVIGAVVAFCGLAAVLQKWVRPLTRD